MKSTPKTPASGIPVGFRLPPALVVEVDAYAAKLTKKTGNPTSRADVVRTALTRWLRDRKMGSDDSH